MGWLIFWGVVIIWWAIGIKRIPTYYKRVANSQDIMAPETPKGCALIALLLASIWLYYEAWVFISDRIIYVSTADERKAKELANARKIIAEYEREQAKRMEGK